MAGIIGKLDQYQGREWTRCVSSLSLSRAGNGQDTEVRKGNLRESHQSIGLGGAVIGGGVRLERRRIRRARFFAQGIPRSSERLKKESTLVRRRDHQGAVLVVVAGQLPVPNFH